jgi:penicillin G amidase
MQAEGTTPTGPRASDPLDFSGALRDVTLMSARGMTKWAGLLCVGVAATGCTSEPAPVEEEKILGIEETEVWTFGELTDPVYVVRTEHDVPHLYATNRNDLGFVLGFVTARDRYFMMDLSRRLGLGRITELLGDAALDIDQESRGSGMTFVTQQVLDGMTPELGEYADSFAAGINAYIEQARQDEVLPPSELQLAQGLLGVSNPLDLMEEFDRRDVAAMITVVLYNSSYETGDIGRAAGAAALGDIYPPGTTFETLREQGALNDIANDFRPIQAFSSVGGFAQTTTQGSLDLSGLGADSLAGKVPPEMFARAMARADKQQRRLQRDRDAGYGSNAWAVSGTHTDSGAGIMAGDGHLSLSVPSILYRFGVNTELFGGGDIHQLGMSVPGLPVVAIGTNGKVAWSQTQLSADNTDWYLEHIQLDDEGRPVRALFQDEWRLLDSVDEEYIVKDVPLLDSVGRTETWTQWRTFDGRWIAEIEGRSASADEVLADGEALVNLRGEYVVPGDLNDDGVITAFSFVYAGFYATSVFAGTEAIGRADSVTDFADKTRGLVAYSQNFAVADNQGNSMFGAFQPFACRTFLERNADGSYPDGSNPNMLLDGNRYGAWTYPMSGGLPDDSDGSDPYSCVIPHDEIPQIVNAPEGYSVNANNDPSGTTLDGVITDDTWFFGGPWNNGFRANRIARELETSIEDGGVSVEDMSRIQGDTTSNLGDVFAPRLLESIDYAAGLGASPSDEADQRIAALYADEKAAIDEVKSRLETWVAGGYATPSGVDTFYAPSHDQAARDDAIATMLFNAWFPRVINGVFGDEGLPGIFPSGGSTGRLRALNKFLDGRGAGNPLSLASFNDIAGESVFFDVLGTDEIETSHEVIVSALVDALAFLRSDPTEENQFEGGFGTSDMSAYIWGLRHYARMESLLADFIGDDPQYATLTDRFAVSSLQCPLEEDGVTPGEDLFGLMWFPRDGDQYAVDASNPGFSGTRFSYGSGPVMRMVVAMKGDTFEGVNIVPGGQSSIAESEFFADQAHLWLGNEVSPMRFTVDQVVEGAVGRESYLP